LLTFWYSLGNFGASILYNLVGSYALFWYCPPSIQGFPKLVSDVPIVGFMTAFGLANLLGRIANALTYPIFSFYLEKSNAHIKILSHALLPFSVFTILTFMPPYENQIHIGNFFWLICTFFLFGISATMWNLPYQALIYKIGADQKTRHTLANMTGLANLAAAAATYVVLPLSIQTLSNPTISSKNLYFWHFLGATLLGAFCMIPSIIVAFRIVGSQNVELKLLRLGLPDFSNYNWIIKHTSLVRSAFGTSILLFGFQTIFLSYPYIISDLVKKKLEDTWSYSSTCLVGIILGAVLIQKMSLKIEPTKLLATAFLPLLSGEIILILNCYLFNQIFYSINLTIYLLFFGIGIGSIAFVSVSSIIANNYSADIQKNFDRDYSASIFSFFAATSSITIGISGLVVTYFVHKSLLPMLFISTASIFSGAVILLKKNPIFSSRIFSVPL